MDVWMIEYALSDGKLYGVNGLSGLLVHEQYKDCKPFETRILVGETFAMIDAAERLNDAEVIAEWAEPFRHVDSIDEASFAGAEAYYVGAHMDAVEELSAWADKQPVIDAECDDMRNVAFVHAYHREQKEFSDAPTLVGYGDDD